MVRGSLATLLRLGMTEVEKTPSPKPNTLISSGHGISIGNPSGPNNSHVAPWHAVGGMIRNNFILQRRENHYNWAFELDNVKDFKVYNNTIYSPDADYFRTFQIYDAPGEGQTTNLDIRNNIIRGGVHDVSSGAWDDADVAAMGNIVDNVGNVVLPSWFVDPLSGDLHLTGAAAAAINAAVPLADVPWDIDTGNRLSLPDMGADEYRIPWPGDANQDGKVGLADLMALADNYGRTGAATWSHGDFTSDGSVGLSDLYVLADHYGDEPGLEATVPEPATLALLAAGVLGIAVRKRRR